MTVAADRRAPTTVRPVIDVPLERFEQLVGDALDLIPEALARRMENVVVLVRDQAADRYLLGLYEGIPLTERDSGYGGMVTPDRITIYRLPILDLCATEAEVVEQVKVTVVHEVGHHFGIDDERLHELGWG
jgi:predicted Zn-dependent protease with MMP-like domain